MKTNNFLNKPFVLSTLISLVYLCAIIATSPIGSSLYQVLLTLVVIFGFSLYMGKSHAKSFKETMPKTDKIKIVLYYFIFWLLFVSSIVILMVMNTTLKGIPLFSMNQEKAVILLTIFLMNFFLFAFNSLFIYCALGLGCKWELSKSNKL